MTGLDSSNKSIQDYIELRSMLSEDGEHAVCDGQSKGRQAAKGYAEFCCLPVANKDEQPSEDHRVTNTKLQYTYPVRLMLIKLYFYLHTLKVYHGYPDVQ